MKAVEQYLPYYSTHENCRVLKKIKIQTAVTKSFQRDTMKTFKTRVEELDKDVFLHFNEIAAGLQRALDAQAQSSNFYSSGIGLTPQDIGVKGGKYSLASKKGVEILLKDGKQIQKAFNAIDKVLETMDTTMREGLGWKEGLIKIIHSGDPEALKKAGIEDGTYELPNSDLKTLISCRKTIENNVAELHSIFPDGGAVNPGGVSSEKIQKLFQGISGAFNKIKGTLYEGEVLIGLLKSDIQGLERVSHTGSKSKNDIMTITEDPAIARDIQDDKAAIKALEDAAKSIKVNNPKADLTLVLDKSHGSGTMGVSVKNTSKTFSDTADRWKNSLSVGTHRNLLRQIQGVNQYLEPLTGTDPLFFGKMLYTVRSPQGAGLQPAQLNDYWYTFLDAVAFLNIVDSLVGSGGYANAASVLVTNGKVYSMQDLLKKIMQYPERVYGHVGKNMTRSAGVALNKWVGVDGDMTTADADKAQERSQELHKNVKAEFAANSLQTKIDLSLLLMLARS